MIEIIPAIFSNDTREVGERLKIIERATGPEGPLARRVQIDIVDGQFAANRTLDPGVLETLETDLALDFHLMTKEPIDWVEKAGRGGADRIIGQIEKMSDQIAFVGKVQELGLSPGLAIDIGTPTSDLDPAILADLDVVLVMAVPAGFGGQKFDPSTLLKINELDKIRKRDATPFRICVDGGIREENIGKVYRAGADEAVIGGRLFEGDLGVNIKKFQEAAK